MRVIEQPSDGMEAQWVVDEIRSLIHEGSLRREIAVLPQQRAVARAGTRHLFRRHSHKGLWRPALFERQEIKHALAYLRLMANPQDDTSLMRVVNFPTRGIGARTLETLADAATHDISLYSAVAMVGGRAVPTCSSPSSSTTPDRGLPLPEMVEHMLEASGLNAHYKAEREGAERLKTERTDHRRGRVRVRELRRHARRRGAETDASSTLMPGVVDAPIVAPDGMTPLAAFLSHAALEAGDNQAQQGQDAVQLMTVHAAKGLEFDAVFITGLEEGLFPHENNILEQSGLERRLMYVAITRARQRLHHAGAEPHAAWTDALRHAFALPEEIPST